MMTLDDVKTYLEIGGSQQGLTQEEYQLLEEAKRQENFTPGSWHENLAEHMEEGELGLLALDIWRWTHWDEASRDPWTQRMMAGIRMLGVVDEVELPPESLRFEGMSKVVHPGLMQACVEFWARSFPELFPADGPVKAVSIGKSNDERLKQAERVADFMNWQYTIKMPGAYEQKSRLLFELPLMGSMFSKPYYDTEEESAMVIRVRPEDFIVPYTASDLRTAARYTHRMWTAQHVVKDRIKAGIYIDRNLSYPTEATYPEMARLKEQAQGTTMTTFVEDRRHCLLECHCHYKIPSLNKLHKLDDDKVLPWIVTMDRDTQQILAVRRNWHEKDRLKRKRMWFTHYGFLPGLGFYNYGLVHAAGGMYRAQSGAVRALLDAAGAQNGGGGFISADVSLDLDTPLGIGEYRKTHATAEELSKAFFPRPLTEPSPVLFNLLGYFDGLSDKLSSTTELMTGDANNNAPVGTTLAIIEQGLKKDTAIRHGIHVALAEEFGILADMNSEFLPLVYPYSVEGDDKAIYQSDFDDRIDIRPVSDPRITTQNQRIAQQQGVMQLAAAYPNEFKHRTVIKKMLEVMRVQDADDYLSRERKAARMDPISEGMAMMTGKPVKAFADQDHDAHMLAHDTAFNAASPDIQQAMYPAYMAHKAEHEAWKLWVSMQQAMGVQLPYPAVMDDDDEDSESPALPLPIEHEIEARAATAVQLMAMQRNQDATIAAQPVPTQAQQRTQAVEAMTENDQIDQAVAELMADADMRERIRQAEEQYPR